MKEQINDSIKEVPFTVTYKRLLGSPNCPEGKDKNRKLFSGASVAEVSIRQNLTKGTRQTHPPLQRTMALAL